MDRKKENRWSVRFDTSTPGGNKSVDRKTNANLVVYSIAIYILLLVLCAYLTHRNILKLKPTGANVVSIEDKMQELLHQATALKVTSESQNKRATEKSALITNSIENIGQLVKEREANDNTTLLRIETNAQNLDTKIVQQENSYSKIKTINVEISERLDETESNIASLLVDVQDTRAKLDANISSMNDALANARNKNTSEEEFEVKMKKINEQNATQATSVRELQKQIETLSDTLNDTEMYKAKVERANLSAQQIKHFPQLLAKSNSIFATEILIQIVDSSDQFETIDAALSQINSYLQALDNGKILLLNFNLKKESLKVGRVSLDKLKKYAKYNAELSFNGFLFSRRKLTNNSNENYIPVAIAVYFSNRYYSRLTAESVIFENDSGAILHLQYNISSTEESDAKLNFYLHVSSKDLSSTNEENPGDEETLSKIRELIKGFGENNDTYDVLTTTRFPTYEEKRTLLGSLLSERTLERLILSNVITMRYSYIGTLTVRNIKKYLTPYGFLENGTHIVGATQDQWSITLHLAKLA